MLKRFFSWLFPTKKEPVSAEQANNARMDKAAAPVLEMVRKALRDGNRDKVASIYAAMTPQASAELCKRMTNDELIQVGAALAGRRR